MRSPEPPLARGGRERRSLRRSLVGSLVAHAFLASLLALWPAPRARPLPAVVSVDLVAALPAPPPARRAPAPRAAPARPAPPPPPPKKILLPEEPSTPAKKASPPPPPPRRKEPPKQIEYEDALASLREELGAEEPLAAAEEPAAQAAAEDEATGSGAEGGSGTVDPELARWQTALKRHVRQTYVTPPEFRGRRLVTCLDVLVTADGRVIGEPGVRRSSGDAFWDDNAVRATLRASPLPPPPEEGEFIFCFPSED